MVTADEKVREEFRDMVENKDKEKKVSSKRVCRHDHI